LLYITRRNWCDFVIFNENLDKIDIKRVERDTKKIEKIVKGIESGKEKIKDILTKIQ